MARSKSRKKMKNAQNPKEPDPLQWQLFGVPDDLAPAAADHSDASESAQAAPLFETLEQTDEVLTDSVEEEEIEQMALFSGDDSTSHILIESLDATPEPESIATENTTLPNSELESIPEITINRLGNPACLFIASMQAAEDCMAQYSQMHEKMVDWLDQDEPLEEASELLTTDQLLEYSELPAPIETFDIDQWLASDEAAKNAPVSAPTEIEELIPVDLNADDSEDETPLLTEAVDDIIEQSVANTELEAFEIVNETEAVPVIVDSKHKILDQEDWEAHLPEVFEVEAAPDAETPLITEALEDFIEQPLAAENESLNSLNELEEHLVIEEFEVEEASDPEIIQAEKQRKEKILAQDNWDVNLPELFDVETDPAIEQPLVTDDIEEDHSKYLRSSPVPWGAGGIGVLSEATDTKNELESEEEDAPADLYFADQVVHGGNGDKQRIQRKEKTVNLLSEKDRKRRAVQIGTLVCVALTLVMGGLLYRVGQLQMQPAEPIAERLDKQRSNRTLFARRGNIVDRRGRLMATSGTAWRLFIDPQLIHDPAVFSEHVGMQLGYDPAMIEKSLFEASPNSRYVVVDEQVPMDARWRLGELKRDPEFKKHFRAVNLEKWMQRRYPQGPLAGNILGFVGKEGKGLEGVEALYQNHLAAKAGKSGYLRDSRLRPLKIEQVDFDEPQDGEPLVLSMDVRIQGIAEEELAMTCQKFEAESAQMVIMNPKTGEILAMANHPTFDPGMALDLLAMGITEPDYADVEENADLDIDALELADLRQAERVMPWRNRTISEVFEPGSTFKPFVWAALTEGGYATPHEMIDCGKSGHWRSSKGRRLKDAHPVGYVDWTTVLVKSSNIGMAIVAERSTHDHLRNLVRRFGFGKTTGSGLMGEEIGLVTSQRNWSHYSQTSVPMGQEIAVTGLQMARATAAIANGGYLVTPTFLKYESDPYMAQPVAINVVNENGQSVPADAKRILQPKSAELTLRAMREVVLRGTGRKLKDSPYGIFGKTGTAQIARSGVDRKINGPGYEPGAYMACFIGGAPVHDPQVVVVCFVKKPNPKKGYYGGLVAGPAVKATINRIMPYLGVPEMQADQEIKRLLPLDQLEQASR